MLDLLLFFVKSAEESEPRKSSQTSKQEGSATLRLRGTRDKVVDARDEARASATRLAGGRPFCLVVLFGCCSLVTLLFTTLHSSLYTSSGIIDTHPQLCV